MAKAEKKAEGQKTVIKKYANRRLYNTAKSSYVTLDDLSKMVRAGEDFGVYDAKTGEEITRSVLTQIIVEEEGKGKDHNMLPTNFLRELIRLYGDPLQGMVPGYLDAAMEAFNENQEQMRKAFGAGAAISSFEHLTRANMDFFEQSLRMFVPTSEESPGSEKASKAETTEKPAQPERRDGDLDALQSQLKEMQEQLAKLTKSAG